MVLPIHLSMVGLEPSALLLSYTLSLQHRILSDMDSLSALYGNRSTHFAALCMVWRWLVSCQVDTN